MGAIGGEEELMRWEKMQIGANDGEEKILVLVRLRPLSEKEIGRNEVSDWECINDTTVLYRNSLQERSGLPTAYTFDRVFRGDCSTRQVYDEGTKEIALSVVGGINSTIFAYGQTSSGKTYTMIGITEYAVADIYDYIKRHEERAFVLKFSAIEIYNEVVKDLLSTDSTPLRILDDPEKGTIVEKLTEETLRDWSHLKELLSICEAERKTGETSLNETSSRSHQILRLTIESSAKEFLGKDKSTTLSASVNFVDLAGSERASQAVSVGTRLKEGCHINRSLLTLGTVIRKLSKGRQGHINYRDSKLTRILQPSLGGNARTAIICTLSPAQSHVEQSRNTLLFASCAKEVTTNAHVNVVMSDKALVKHLQKELARLESELRTPAPTLGCDYGALLKKKDLRIEKMEKEIRELTKQRDLAQSRVEDLLQVIENDQASRQWVGVSCRTSWQLDNTCEDECSVSSGVSNLNCMDVGVRKFNTCHYNEESGGKHEDCSVSDATSPILNGLKDNELRKADDTDDLYKDVQCIDTEESSKDHNFKLLALSSSENAESLPASSTVDVNDRDQGIVSTPLRGDVVAGQVQSGSTYDMLEPKVHDVQKASDSLGNPLPNKPSSWALEREMSSCKSMKLTRSRSCGNVITGSSSPSSEMAGQNVKTPIDGSEKCFPGRPDGLQKRFPLSKRSVYFQSSFGVDSQLEAPDTSPSGDEDITSIQTFVAGLKEMAELQYEKQIDDAQVERSATSAKNVKDVGLDPMHDLVETPRDWPSEFERQQKAIIELWQTCNISLVHRTYFFLLFKGDPSDSIYMEVELRRLSFLKDKFLWGSLAVEGGRDSTMAASIRTLQREREALCKLIQKRFSEKERERLYKDWGIGLGTKRRRLQLTQRLWSNTKDLKHITDSAAIIAKLVKFSEQERTLKEMFGLSFAPPRAMRRSFRWKHGMKPLL